MEEIKLNEDITFYYRNNNTGNPTKKHIINPKTGKSFCGFDNFCAEVQTNTSKTHFKVDICTKCLKSYNKTI